MQNMTTEPLMNRQLTLFAETVVPSSVYTLELEMEARRLRAREINRLLRRFGRFLRDKLIEPLVRVAERDRVYRELMALDDRTLADIGIARHQIPAIAARVAARVAEGAAQPVAAPAQVQPTLPLVPPVVPAVANDRKPALAA
jgi:uncharacterized protein YjiS (DUF1127 family)